MASEQFILQISIQSSRDTDADMGIQMQPDATVPCIIPLLVALVVFYLYHILQVLKEKGNERCGDQKQIYSLRKGLRQNGKFTFL